MCSRRTGLVHGGVYSKRLAEGEVETQGRVEVIGLWRARLSRPGLSSLRFHWPP
jgi:hypothetical protein